MLLLPAACPDGSLPQPLMLELSGKGKLSLLLSDFCLCPGKRWGIFLLPQFFTRAVNAEKAKVSKHRVVAMF